MLKKKAGQKDAHGLNDTPTPPPPQRVVSSQPEYRRPTPSNQTQSGAFFASSRSYSGAASTAGTASPASTSASAAAAAATVNLNINTVPQRREEPSIFSAMADMFAASAEADRERQRAEQARRDREAYAERERQRLALEQQRLDLERQRLAQEQRNREVAAAERKLADVNAKIANNEAQFKQVTSAAEQAYNNRDYANAIKHYNRALDLAIAVQRLYASHPNNQALDLAIVVQQLYTSPFSTEISTTKANLQLSIDAARHQLSILKGDISVEQCRDNPAMLDATRQTLSRAIELANALNDTASSAGLLASLTRLNAYATVDRVTAIYNKYANTAAIDLDNIIEAVSETGSARVDLRKAMEDISSNDHIQTLSANLDKKQRELRAEMERRAEIKRQEQLKKEQISKQLAIQTKLDEVAKLIVLGRFNQALTSLEKIIKDAEQINAEIINNYKPSSDQPAIEYIAPDTYLYLKSTITELLDKQNDIAAEKAIIKRIIDQTMQNIQDNMLSGETPVLSTKQLDTLEHNVQDYVKRNWPNLYQRPAFVIDDFVEHAAAGLTCLISVASYFTWIWHCFSVNIELGRFHMTMHVHMQHFIGHEKPVYPAPYLPDNVQTGVAYVDKLIQKHRTEFAAQQQLADIESSKAIEDSLQKARSSWSAADYDTAKKHIISAQNINKRLYCAAGNAAGIDPATFTAALEELQNLITAQQDRRDNNGGSAVTDKVMQKIQAEISQKYHNGNGNNSLLEAHTKNIQATVAKAIERNWHKFDLRSDEVIDSIATRVADIVANNSIATDRFTAIWHWSNAGRQARNISNLCQELNTVINNFDSKTAPTPPQSIALFATLPVTATVVRLDATTGDVPVAMLASVGSSASVDTSANQSDFSAANAQRPMYVL
jgi:hypothetical protein